MFSNLFVEHVLHAFQQLHTAHLKLHPDAQYEEVILQSARLLLDILKGDPNNERSKDKQNEYLFERETAQTVDLIVNQIKILNDATPKQVVRHPRLKFDSRSGIMSASETCGPKASPVFHLLNDPDLILLEEAADKKALETKVEKPKYITLPNERRRLMAMGIQQMDEVPASVNAQVKVMIVSGSVGVGKVINYFLPYISYFVFSILTLFFFHHQSYFSLHLARTIEDKFRGDQSFQKFHLRLRCNSEFPMTSLEAKQDVIKLWHVGSLPVKDKKEVDELYNKTFYGKTSVILLEDASSLRQIIDLIPNVRQSVRSQVYIIVETRSTSLSSSQTNLDKIQKYTTGQVDFLDSNGIVNKKAESLDATKKDDLSDHDSDFEDSDEEDDELDIESDDGHRTEEQKAIQEQMMKMFGKKKRRVVPVTLIEDKEDQEMDDDEAIRSMFDRMKHFYVLFMNLGKLTLEGSTELVMMGNDRAKAESIRTLGVLLDNVPIFLKIVGRTHFLYCSGNTGSNNISTQDMVKYISTQVDEVAKKSNYSRIRQLCHGSFIGCFRKWPEHIQQFVFMLTLWPNAFDPISCALVTEIPLSKVLVYLFELMQIGILYAVEPLRYALHDLARETYSAHLYEVESLSMAQSVEDGKSRYLQHYYNMMSRLNMEHQYSGIEFMPGTERYDIELENMKSVLNFMQAEETDHIEAINKARYLLRHRVFALHRGMLYQHLSQYIDDCENPFVKAEFLEGFAYVYFDLTDYAKALSMASRALSIKEDAVIISEEPIRELELLTVLQLLSDIYLEIQQFAKAKECLERMVLIAERHAFEWQKVKVDVQTEGFEDETVIIIDPFLGYAQKALAMICLTNGDIKGGRRYFERGIGVMRCVLCPTHPELSQSYANYASTLVKFKAKQFFDEICRLMDQAVAIDSALFGEKSVIVGDRLNEYGVALLHMSKYAQAEDCFRKSLIIRQKNFGTKDMIVAATTNNLAVACKNVGKLDESEKLYRRALDTTFEILGEKDPLVSIARANLAQTLSSLGRSDEARELFQQSINDLSKDSVSAEDAGKMAVMLQQMGDNSRKQEKYEEALQYFEQALNIRKQLCKDPTNDPDSAKISSSIAQVFYDQGKYEECESLIDQCLAPLEKAFGKKHPTYNAALTSMGNSKFKRGKFVDAEEIFVACLQLKREAGETPFQLINTQHALAIVYEATKQYDKAIEAYREMLKAVESVKPVDVEKQKAFLRSIATDLTKKGQFKEALNYYGKIETIIIDESSDESLDYGDLVYNMGACQLSYEAFDDAERSFAKAYQIFCDKLGDSHERTLEAADMLAEIRRIIYERDNAKCCKCCNVM